MSAAEESETHEAPDAALDALMQNRRDSKVP
jgi:hypothetical protein